MVDENLTSRILGFFESKPEYVEVLQRIVDYESSNPSDMGWPWHDVHCAAAKLKKLVEEGILRIVFKTQSTTHYSLIDLNATREALRLTEAGRPAETKKLEIPKDLFSVIVGYDDVCDVLRRSLGALRKVHVLLWGSPSSAKSLFLLELGRISGAVYALGSSSTKAGLADLLLQHMPPVLMVDEIEKMNMRDAAVLLSLMETGIVSESKYHRRRQEKLDTMVVAAANRINGLPPELRSRFMALHFREYDEPTYREIVEHVLVEREGCDRELARHITEVAIRRLRTRDVRDAVRLSRICKSVEEVDRMIETMERYRG